MLFLLLPLLLSQALLRQDFDTTWKAGCWRSAIGPLTQLTSLQLQVPLVLAPGDDLQLEGLTGLKRLELLLDRPVAMDGNSMAEVGWGVGCGFRVEVSLVLVGVL
jgi:hypothetical protein